MSRNLFVFAAMSLLLAACSRSSVLSETKALTDGAWGYDEVFQTGLEVGDTLTPHNFFFLVRNGSNYRYRNLIIYFRTYFPNNTYMVDTIDCPLADERGKWLGSGLGGMLDNEILFKTNVQFPFAGTYKFEIQHAMRMDTVQEIYDLGLRIEPVSR